MADSIIVLRQRTCRAEGCGALFFICRSCDRGQSYCSQFCGRLQRRQQCRAANRRHQQSPEGRADHRDRQRACCQRQQQARVTDLPRAALNVGLQVMIGLICVWVGYQGVRYL